MIRWPLLAQGEPNPAQAQHYRTEEDRSDGAAIFRNASTKSRSPTDHIAPLLPSSSNQIHTLRAKPTDQPITSPKQQAILAKKFWGGEIWKNRQGAPGASARAEYLKSYTKKLPDSKKPGLPTIEAVHDILDNPKTTSPGPDGMPFSLYSELRDISAPHPPWHHLLHGGGPPPPLN